MADPNQIIAFHKVVPILHAVVLGNVCEYCHKLYVAETLIL